MYPDSLNKQAKQNCPPTSLTSWRMCHLSAPFMMSIDNNGDNVGGQSELLGFIIMCSQHHPNLVMVHKNTLRQHELAHNFIVLYLETVFCLHAYHFLPGLLNICYLSHIGSMTIVQIRRIGQLRPFDT